MLKYPVGSGLKSTNNTKQMPGETSLGRSQNNEFPAFALFLLPFFLFSPCLSSFSLGTRVVPMEECKVGGGVGMDRPIG